MRDGGVNNPVINSPFEEPARHFRFDENGITEDLVEGRRVSSYFMPIPRTKKRNQLAFDTEWTKDRLEEDEGLRRLEMVTSVSRSCFSGNVIPTEEGSRLYDAHGRGATRFLAAARNDNVFANR